LLAAQQVCDLVVKKRLEQRKKGRETKITVSSLGCMSERLYALWRRLSSQFEKIDE